MILSSQKQHGAGLLIMMLILVIGVASFLISTADRIQEGQQRQTKTYSKLQEAKQALLGYAASISDRSPGLVVGLPCPDLDAGGGYEEGIAHSGSCGSDGVTMLGRLPWKSLGMQAVTDASGACFWYVVSGNYKQSSGFMINPDNNGRLRLLRDSDGTELFGSVPTSRAVAFIVSANASLSSQTRSSRLSPAQPCSNDFNAGHFLDANTDLGINNAMLTGVPGVDTFISGSVNGNETNDQFIAITREDIEAIVVNRSDYLSRIQNLGTQLAHCIADYGRLNAGGNTDKRLPFPSAVLLTDYSDATNYSDHSTSVFSGRLANDVRQSAALTGNSIESVITGCDSARVPGWNAELQSLWQNWKDHFFYYVAAAYAPSAATPSSCGNCLTVNGSGSYSAVIVFSNHRLEALSQIRNAPPVDVDTRGTISNYLEDNNAAMHPYSSGSTDLSSRTGAGDFNDVLFCIDENLSVSTC